MTAERGRYRGEGASWVGRWLLSPTDKDQALKAELVRSARFHKGKITTKNTIFFYSANTLSHWRAEISLKHQHAQKCRKYACLLQKINLRRWKDQYQYNYLYMAFKVEVRFFCSVYKTELDLLGGIVFPFWCSQAHSPVTSQARSVGKVDRIKTFLPQNNDSISHLFKWQNTGRSSVINASCLSGVKMEVAWSWYRPTKPHRE